MTFMPDVEFLPDGQDDAPGASDPARPDRGPILRRSLVAGAVVALVAVAAVVVGTGGGTSGHRPHAATGNTHIVTHASVPSPTTSTLSLPESVVFGPEAVDVLAAGNSVYALTPTLIGVAERDAGIVTARPAPLGLSNRTGYGKLVPDLDNRIMWVVAIGGQTIGAYDTDHLDSLADATSPYPINAAVAMDEKLYFTTDHGMYTAEAGPGGVHRMPGSRAALGALVALPDQHFVAAVDRRPVAKLHFYADGILDSFPLGVPGPTTLVYTDSALWAAGPGNQLYRIDTDRWAATAHSPLESQLTGRTAIVASYGDRVLVRAASGQALYCMDARDGSFKQKWTAPPGAVTINNRGVLIASRQGIAQFNARDCLSG